MAARGLLALAVALLTLACAPRHSDLDLETVVREAQAGVPPVIATVLSEDPGGAGVSIARGVMVSPDIMATTCHGLDPDTAVARFPARARMHRVARAADLCLWHLPARPGPGDSVRLAPSSMLRADDPVFVTPSPTGGQDPGLQPGTYLQHIRTAPGESVSPSGDLFLIDGTRVHQGASGGPVINRHGRVVGLTVMTRQRYVLEPRESFEGIVIPSEDIAELLDRVEARR